MKVMCLKLAKSRLKNPKQIIWDKMYFVKEESVIPLLSPCSIVIPLTSGVINMLCNTIDPKNYKLEIPLTEHQFERSLIEDKKVILDKKVFAPYNYMVILILTTQDKKRKATLPKYISSDGHASNLVKRGAYRNASSNVKFPPNSYLQTPVGKIDPICMGCRRSMDGLLGKCTLGEAACYRELIFSGVKSFQQMMEEGNALTENFKYLDLEIDINEKEDAHEFI